MVPFFIHEAEIDRHLKIHKRDFIEKILLIILLVITNASWLWYESQFEEVTTTQEVEQSVEYEDGNVNIIGIGDMYGESKTDY